MLSMNEINSTVKETKPHVVVLDGLHGMAALAVVVFQFMVWVSPDASRNFITHGFLCVDSFSVCQGSSS